LNLLWGRSEMPERRSSWVARWAERKDRQRGWDKASKPFGLLMLKGIQDKLRRENLYDTDSTRPIVESLPKSPPKGAMTGRMENGTFNDLEMPGMGSIGTRFGRESERVAPL